MADGSVTFSPDGSNPSNAEKIVLSGINMYMEPHEMGQVVGFEMSVNGKNFRWATVADHVNNCEQLMRLFAGAARRTINKELANG